MGRAEPAYTWTRRVIGPARCHPWQIGVCEWCDVALYQLAAVDRYGDLGAGSVTQKP